MGVDGSCLHELDNTDLEEELGVKSRISRRKIMKWVEGGFYEFDQYLKSKLRQKGSMIELC